MTNARATMSRRISYVHTRDRRILRHHRPIRLWDRLDACIVAQTLRPRQTALRCGLSALCCR